MDKLTQKHQQLKQAVSSLEKALKTFTRLAKEKRGYDPNTTYEEDYKTHRDSVIQRFEYTTDIFWKYLKKYMEDTGSLSGMKIPSEIARTAYSIELLNEEEAQTVLAMIRSRNLTSHMYVEELAEDLVEEIPHYYQVLNAVLHRFEGK